nr:MAG TPA: hypothetical protein [Caudoviricetes sp.]
MKPLLFKGLERSFLPHYQFRYSSIFKYVEFCLYNSYLTRFYGQTWSLICLYYYKICPLTAP